LLADNDVAQPSVLYHYTQAPGLLGVCSSRSLRLTDIRFLNDIAELRYSVELARAHLDHLAANTKTDPERQLLENWRMLLYTPEGIRFYLASFCEDGDQLSQWRAYGQEGGYAIGFAPERLKKAAESLRQPYALMKCVYKLDEQEGLMATITSTLLDALRANWPSEDHLRLKLLTELSVQFSTFLMSIAASLKHPAFAEEREWRLVTTDPIGGRPARKSFRLGRRTIVPYIEMNLVDAEKVVRFERVIVGPTPHVDISCEAVRALLTEIGVWSGGVEATKIPYRDW
jgi:hypothetical protein